MFRFSLGQSLPLLAIVQGLELLYEVATKMSRRSPTYGTKKAHRICRVTYLFGSGIYPHVIILFDTPGTMS